MFDICEVAVRKKAKSYKNDKTKILMGFKHNLFNMKDLRDLV